MPFIRIAVAFISAALVAGLVGTAASTQFVIGALEGAGAVVPMGDRVAMTLHDIAGMGPIYTIVCAIGLAIAFVVAWLLLKVVPIPRWAGYALAGGAAILTVLFLIQQQFWGTMPVSGARSTVGFIAQIGAGALGGLVFAALSGPRKTG